MGECENLDLPDASFDAVSSTCGVMFAPDHAATARELGRIVRPGGRIALANRTPEGGAGDMFRVMGPFQPAPPPSSPFHWGKPARVEELLGADFELDISEQVSTLPLPSAQAYWDLFVGSYGPTKTLAELLASGAANSRPPGSTCSSPRTPPRTAPSRHTREYLLIVGTRR